MRERRLRVVRDVSRMKGTNGEGMSEGNQPEKEDRKPYEAPRIIRVSLRPDEAVLGHCKISGVAGPGNSSCGALFCRTPGS
jgi:hypothetical protein